MIKTAPQEVDPGNRGRILDSLYSWTRGALAGVALTLWVALGLGMSLEMLEVPVYRVFDLMTRCLIAAGALGGLAFVTVDALRTRHYIDCLARAGADKSLPPAVEYQAARMRGEAPFFTVQVIAGILIGIGALMAIGALTTMDDGSSFFIFAAIGAAGLWGGFALFKAARKAKAWAGERRELVRIARSHVPEGEVQWVPQQDIGAGLTRWQRALEILATAPTVAAMVGLVIWGAATGRLAVIGDRVTLLPDGFHRELSESDLAWGHAISSAVVVAAIWVLILSLPIAIIGIIRYERIHRALGELRESSREPASFLKPRVAAVALTTESTWRRITFYGAGAGTALICLGIAGVITGRPGVAISFVIGAILLVGPIIIDVRSEPAERARRNALLRAWPNAKLGEK